MTKANREKRIREHAEWVWEQAQMRAAAAYQAVGAAYSIFEKERPADLPQEEIDKVVEQVEEQKKRIETYLMGEKDAYLKRLNDIHA